MPTPKTILIIDDDDDLREALAEQLNLHEEFKTQQASTATDGVRMGREIRADLILLDVDLPDMDGREACRLLRKAYAAGGPVGVVGPAPAIEALGNSSGFAFRLQDRAGHGQQALGAARDQLLAAARQSPILTGLRVEGLPDAAQVNITIDREKREVDGPGSGAGGCCGD